MSNLITAWFGDAQLAGSYRVERLDAGYNEDVTLFVERSTLFLLYVWWSSEKAGYVYRYGEHYSLPEEFAEGMNALAADLRMQQTFMKVFLIMAVE